MLRSLSIRDVVLIHRLDLAFEGGLGVLTGETGAGKSILLDALGLALGARGEARLVRHGAERAVVAAGFDVPAGHPVRKLLDDQGLEGQGLEGAEDLVVLRRVLNGDGRSRAFVNDQPVSVTLLRQVGDGLTEIHGQFESQRLLDSNSHRGLLDAYGALRGKVTGTRAAFRSWRAASERRAVAERSLEDARRDEAFLRHAVDELTKLDPKPGEEKDLADQRAALMHGEKLLGAMNEARAELEAGRGVDAALRGALGRLERVVAMAGGRLDSVVAAFDRAAAELAEGLAGLEHASAAVDLDPRRLEQAEERLFALRACARKHAVEVEALTALRARFTARLAAVDDGGGALERLRREEAEARAGYVTAAEALTAARRAAALKLDAAMAGELAPLKLDKAVFVTAVEPLSEESWAADGFDRVAFCVATNPGAPPGPIAKIASGGELSRFMLALKVVLAQADPVPTIVFDEVDSGVGGAVAAAVGDCLARLATDVQVLVVTHSPQVAARGAHHWRVSKRAAEGGEAVETSVEVLSEPVRREEIARMLAGARVTDEARAAAASLLEGARR